MGSNDHVPVPDPKPVVFAEFTLGEGDGHECGICGGPHTVLHVNVKVGQYRTDGYRCAACRYALGRCLMRAWEGNLPDIRDFLPDRDIAARIKAANDNNVDDQTSQASQAGP